MRNIRTLSDGRCVVPVRSLVVEVIRGEDRGRRIQATSDRISVGSAGANDLVLADTTVSRYHCELHHLGDRIQVVDLGSTNGTLLGTAALERATVAPGTVLTVGHSELRVLDGDPVELDVHEADRMGDLVGRSAEIRSLMASVEKAGRANISILILGETGVGKELVARAVHDASVRRGGPFEIVDCGALAPTLVASELFGHEKGAFTGATEAHAGAFERADGGTLFLDEIGELPPSLQTALLGALERGAFRRVGGKTQQNVDVRVLCATHRELRTEVNAGRFREDLFYRIGVVTLRIPPLRDRVDDIPLLVEHFLRSAGHDGPVEAVIPKAGMERLRTHRWPGNVRELRNFVEATLAMGQAPTLPVAAPVELPEDEAQQLLSSSIQELLALDYKTSRARVLSDFERLYLTVLLERSGQNVSRAARLSKIHRSYLNEMLKRHHLR